MHDIQAHLRFLSISAQKVRLVVDMVRGRSANEALELLRFETAGSRAASSQAAGIRGGERRGEFRRQPGRSLRGADLCQ